MPEFLDFGKNTIFILGCYGLSFAVLAGLILHTLKAKSRAKTERAELENTTKMAD
ncbi:hypothetical protein MNBD_ALPHA06-1858 [hydrothermal vent metagenome]|uniref:Heme exporter protein D n=1 Tax=hydrothermal vent metagenome TaxID=652676 RepID=A0A3B0SY18_9ZZZZ